MTEPRKLRMEDLLDDLINVNDKKTYNNKNDIPKNQKVFGHNKRIKP
jgi:hypothetical protein